MNLELTLWILWFATGILYYGIWKNEKYRLLKSGAFDETGSLMRYSLLEDCVDIISCIFFGGAIFLILALLILPWKFLENRRRGMCGLDIGIRYFIPNHLRYPGNGFPLQITADRSASLCKK